MRNPYPFLMLAVVAVCLTVGTAGATVSGHDGRVVFTRHPGLFTMNPDGTAVRRLTRPPTGLADTDPKLSPDGSTVVFERDDAKGNGQIYTIRADGTQLAQLTRCDTKLDPACASNNTPAWTPDGRTIVFSHCCTAVSGGTLVGLDTMAADGSNVRQITLNPDLDWGDVGPTVSPDGRWVAFSRMIGATPGNGDQSVSALFVVGIDGSGLRQVTSYDLMVDEKDWSPDGSRIVFTSHAGSNSGPFRADLFSVAPDGSRLTQLTHTTPGQTWACCPSWAPSGGRIIFLSFPQGAANDQVDTMLPDGTHRRQVTSSAGELSWGSTPLQCKVPDVRSRSLAAARRAIVRDHCTVGRTTKARSTSVPRGEVISERPAAGTFGQDHAKVGLILSAGPRATGRTH